MKYPFQNIMNEKLSSSTQQDHLIKFTLQNHEQENLDLLTQFKFDTIVAGDKIIDITVRPKLLKLHSWAYRLIKIFFFSVQLTLFSLANS